VSTNWTRFKREMEVGVWTLAMESANSEHARYVRKNHGLRTEFRKNKDGGRDLYVRKDR